LEFDTAILAGGIAAEPNAELNWKPRPRPDASGINSKCWLDEVVAASSALLSG